MALADTGSGPDVFGYLLNYGVLGILTILWLIGRIRTGADVAAATKRAEDAEQRERDMQNALRTEVVPALVRFTDTAARILDRDADRRHA